jgi:hypothetical protein
VNHGRPTRGTDGAVKPKSLSIAIVPQSPQIDLPSGREQLIRKSVGEKEKEKSLFFFFFFFFFSMFSTQLTEDEIGDSLRAVNYHPLLRSTMRSLVSSCLTFLTQSQSEPRPVFVCGILTDTIWHHHKLESAYSHILHVPTIGSGVWPCTWNGDMTYLHCLNDKITQMMNVETLVCF